MLLVPLSVLRERSESMAYSGGIGASRSLEPSVTSRKMVLAVMNSWCTM